MKLMYEVFVDGDSLVSAVVSCTGRRRQGNEQLLRGAEAHRQGD